MPMGPNPHDRRLAAREAHYPNERTEREAVAAVDAEVFDQVRPFEDLVLQAAEKFSAESTARVRRAGEIADAIYADITYMLTAKKALPDQSTARKLERLRAEAAVVIEALERAEADADFHIGRLTDPAGAHRAFLDRWPVLNR